MKKVIFLFFLLSLSVSCSSGFYSELTRSISDPIVSVPKVTSFAVENEIFIEWELDPLADQYILYRAKDAGILNFQEIYRGTKLSFRDSIQDSNKSIFQYSLAKIRGKKIFEKSSSVMGILSETTSDLYENNDTKDRAVELVHTIESNIFEFRDLNNFVLSDVDWYKVTVPPRFSANINIAQTSELSNPLTNNFAYQLVGFPIAEIANDELKTIVNSSNNEMVFYFAISAYPNRFTSALTPGGGTILNYRIKRISDVAN